VLGVDEALAAGREYGIEVVPALELSTRSEPERDLVDVDILGYWIDPHDSGLLYTLDRVMTARRDQKIAQIERLQAEGLDVPVDEVLALAAGVPGRPHIVEVIWRRNPGRFQSKQQIFQEFLSENGKAYVRRAFSLTAEQAIEAVLSAGGLPVLAHPGLYRHVRDIDSVIRRLRDAGLKGLEVAYPYDKAPGSEIPSAQVETVVEHFRRLAETLGLLVTGGTDYHGTRSPRIRLGECGLTWEAYQALKERVQQRLWPHPLRS